MQNPSIFNANRYPLVLYRRVQRIQGKPRAGISRLCAVILLRILLQNSSILIQNSSILIQKSSFLIYNSSFLIQNSSTHRALVQDVPRRRIHQKELAQVIPAPGNISVQFRPIITWKMGNSLNANIPGVSTSSPRPQHQTVASACKNHHF